MSKSNEINIPYSTTFPVHVHIHDFTTPVRHWHLESEVFFVLTGEAEVIVEGSSFIVQPEDVFFINANEIHQITGSCCKMLSIMLQPQNLPYIEQHKTTRFNLNSSNNTHATKYDYIRYLIAQFVKMNSNGEHLYKTLSIVFAIYSHLNENFLAEPLKEVTFSKKNRDRIMSILSYMEQHYTEGLTLSDIAKSQNLSVPYLASFFERNTGKTFLTYYNEIRLSHAVNAMLFSDESLENIALSNGFNDSRSFVALFKKKYNMLPSTYRRQHTSKLFNPDSIHTINDTNQTISLDSIQKANAFHTLSKYLLLFKSEAAPPSLINTSSRRIDAGSVSIATSGVQLRHTYHRLMCVGSAKQFLYQEVQDMIRTTQKEIHYDYVKFHGLLSDDMMVYTEKQDGTPVYTFTLIDKVFDFLLSVGLRPLCQLSFMPRALALDPERTINMGHFNTSPPKDMKKWRNLIDALIRHLIIRYGIIEVREWLFCLWNEPDGTVNEYSWSNRQLFFDFYQLTYKTVKSIDSNFRFGTPSLLLSIIEEQGWATEYFQYCAQNDCQPDFLNIHYYDNTLFKSDTIDRQRSNGLSINNMNESFPLSVDPYAFMKFINHLKQLCKKYHMKSLPIYLTEWNLTISHRDLINDTCFKSCYLMKNLLENYDRLESFGYWCLTDFIEELPLPNNLYHGGLGMFTYNGIPKAHYQAFRFLRKLDNELIAKGDGYFITKEESHISIIIYNYEHYSKLFASGIMMNLSNENRYAPFSEMCTAQFTVQFTDIPYDTCLIKEMFINQYYGSSYDTWIRMGGQHLYNKEDLDILRQQSQPGMYLHEENIENNLLTLHVQLAPLEVRLITIDFTL